MNRTFSPVPLCAGLLLFVATLPAQSPPVTLAVRTFRDGAQTLRVTNNSSQPLTALALSCPARTSTYHPAGRSLVAPWEDSTWGIAALTHLAPWQVVTGGEHMPSVKPGETTHLLLWGGWRRCQKPGTAPGQLFGAAIFADGSSVGDGRLVQRILMRRKLAYQDVSLAILGLKTELRAGESRAQAAHYFAELDEGAHMPSTTPSERYVADSVFAMAAEDLRQSRRLYGDEVPASQTIREILNILEDWRARLLASKPPIQ